MKIALLETSKQILHDFQDEFAKTGQLDEKDNAYAWLYGARRYHPLIHRMRESRPLPSFYTQAAKPLFDKWLELSLDVQNIDSYRSTSSKSYGISGRPFATVSKIST